MSPDEIQAIIDAICALHRERCFAMEQRKRVDLALGAYLRLVLGWSINLPEAERKKISERAALMADDLDAAGEHSDIVSASHEARNPFAEIEAAALKKMIALAKQLPVWEFWGECVRGFGPASLAVVVGEAGDLSLYPTKGHLWKRMGLAVIGSGDGVGDVRQGGLPKNAAKDEWVSHGYSRQRRSRMWNIGDALIKGNRDGIYRTAYLARKDYELQRDPDMAPIKAHRRAQRYMEKRLLKDLWQSWRRAMVAVPEHEAKPPLPAADNHMNAAYTSTIEIGDLDL